jgi:hypothetical protein
LTGVFRNYIPLKDNYTITVYHGLNNARDLSGFLKYGTTGKMRAGRIYSYEADNNPYGLFVTIDLKVAKKFARDYIIEFHTKVSDLEAPVWPSGGFTIQGQESKSWNSQEERKERQLKNREELRNSKDKFISLSDRPELAETLYLNSEHQALFTGDLNSNSIKAIWKREYKGNYTRYERKSFLEKFGSNIEKEGYKTERNEMGQQKLLRPRDKVTIDNFLLGMKRHPLYNKMFENKPQEFLNLLKKSIKGKYEEYPTFVWPHQIDDTIKLFQNLD